MNEKILKSFGFDKQVELAKNGKCVFCETKINPEKDFKDRKSREEYRISGMCQKCQDQVFKEDE